MYKSGVKFLKTLCIKNIKINHILIELIKKGAFLLHHWSVYKWWLWGW